MKNSKAIGSPISQNDRNVNTFSERNFKGSPLSQNDRFVNPFSENFFEGFIAQKLSDVKSFLKYFSESPNAQTEENVKTFFKIFFFGAELRNKVTNLKAELDASEYRTFVYAFNKVSQAFTSAAGTELGDKIMNGMNGLGEVFLNPLPSFNPIDILIGKQAYK